MIEIRDMNLDDFEKIKDCLQTDFDEFWNSSILKSELENINSHYIVATDADNILGFAGIIVSLDDAEITNIVTKKTERKNGIGKLLLDKLIKMAREYGKDKISLEVNEENIAAIRLYEKFEFEKVGLRKKYYNGKNDAIIMTKKI